MHTGYLREDETECPDLEFETSFQILFEIEGRFHPDLTSIFVQASDHIFELGWGKEASAVTCLFWEVDDQEKADDRNKDCQYSFPDEYPSPS